MSTDVSACRYEEREVNRMEKERSTGRYAVDGRGRETERLSWVRGEVEGREGY